MKATHFKVDVKYQTTSGIYTDQFAIPLWKSASYDIGYKPSITNEDIKLDTTDYNIKSKFSQAENVYFLNQIHLYLGKKNGLHSSDFYQDLISVNDIIVV